MIKKTLLQLTSDFKNYLQAQNSKINANAPYTFWSILAGAIAAFFLDLYGSLQLLLNAVYPQTSIGDQVDMWLYSLGLPARQLPTYSLVNCFLVTGSETIAIGDTFTSQETGNIWVAKQAFTIPNNTTSFTLYSTQVGSNYSEVNGNILVGNSFNVTVDTCMIGAQEETDQSCINRILQAKRAPLAGARATDYAVYCLQYNTTQPSTIITDSIIVPGFQQINEVKILGVCPLVGSDITDYQLDQGLINAPSNFYAYTRQATASTCEDIFYYINSLRLVGLSVSVIPCVTYRVASDSAPLNVSIALANGYAMDTQLQVDSQDANGQPIIVTLTVTQLVQRELKRAINNQAFGATVISELNYITIESLVTSVISQLGVNVGQLAQFLTNFVIDSADILVPAYSVYTDKLEFTYDIESYDSIAVTQQ